MVESKGAADSKEASSDVETVSGMVPVGVDEVEVARDEAVYALNPEVERDGTEAAPATLTGNGLYHGCDCAERAAQ